MDPKGREGKGNEMKGRETPNKTVGKDELHLDAVGFN